ncbi:DUF397 domain-containing protein [Nocardia sp. NPDC049220]
MEVEFVDRGSVGVWDNKNPNGPALVFTQSRWDACTTGVQDEDFELPA